MYQLRSGRLIIYSPKPHMLINMSLLKGKTQSGDHRRVVLKPRCDGRVVIWFFQFG